ncbi:unnamed protein product [Penicillium roqueforti FM164]|uniref:Genomic scaffold, ProqFM164S03 n=1 Tax=Penicillium roqueforti (strain FM164) TaxID=1365484 RepID=W6QDC3_PENRF|nr:unnamed protein product [Penicillium roqueforti FM164]
MAQVGLEPEATRADSDPGTQNSVDGVLSFAYGYDQFRHTMDGV